MNLGLRRIEHKRTSIFTRFGLSKLLLGHLRDLNDNSINRLRIKNYLQGTNTRLFYTKNCATSEQLIRAVGKELDAGVTKNRTEIQKNIAVAEIKIHKFLYRITEYTGTVMSSRLFDWKF